MNPVEIEQLLKQGVEAAIISPADVHYEATQAAEMQNITTILTVRFGDGATEATVLLTQLIEYLRERATLAGIDLIGPPKRQVVLHGLFHGDPFKIVFAL